MIFLWLLSLSAAAGVPVIHGAAPQCKVSVAPGKAAVRTVHLSSSCHVFSNGCSGPVDALPLANELTPACHTHDWCYSCGYLVLPLTAAGRQACDQRFKQNMHAICQSRFAGQDSNLQSCRSTADMMYAAVTAAQADKPLTRDEPCSIAYLKLAFADYGFSLQYAAGEAVVKTLTVSNGGRWGAWQELAQCPGPPGSFVSGLATKVEPDQGFFGDDSGLNSIAASCSTKAGAQTAGSIKSYEGQAGSWSAMQQCPTGHHVLGFRLRVQPSHGPLQDDLAADAVELVCSDQQKTVLSTPNAVGAGQWSDWQMCPAGAAVCSFRIKYEQDGVLDDTGLNDLEMGCCKLAP